MTVSAFGSIGPSGSADNPFGYLGGLGYWQDPSLADSAGSGLQYVRQRWLENGSGQWLSVDPVATEPRYAYAHNSPAIVIDPSGTLPPWAQKVLDKVEQVAHDSAKAFYTNRWDASDEEYYNTLDNINEGLSASNASITATKQRILLHAEASVRNWAQRQSAKNASAFSEILAAILPFLPSAPHIPTTVMAGLDKLFAGKATQASKKASVKFDWLIALMPPEHGTKDAFLYQVGFLWGIFLAAVYYIDLISVVNNILSFALDIAKTEDIWSLLGEAALGLFAPILQATDAAGLSPFARGKLAATILTSLVLLIIDALDKARHITNALGFVKRVAGRFGRGGIGTASVSESIGQIQANLDSTSTDKDGIEAEARRQVEAASVSGRKPLRFGSGYRKPIDDPDPRVHITAQYDYKATGQLIEEEWMLADRQTTIRVDGRDASTNLLTEAKYGGKDSKGWARSRFNPRHPRYTIEHREATLLYQASQYLRLTEELNGVGVRYRVSPRELQSHLQQLFATHFPEAMKSGKLRVEFFPAND